MMCCAACGIAEVDDIKLKDCDACKSIRYCSEDCQRNHRQQYEQKCKKRAAELRDEILFKQPENNCYGDCPLCCLPLPPKRRKKVLQTCCSTVICDGCCYANKLRKGMNDIKCPFCRHPLPATTAEAKANQMKRIEVNDPVAIRQMGADCCKKMKFDTAFQYLTKAAELGDTVAHYHLSLMHKNGEVDEKDAQKEVYHMEEAAIGGHPLARYNLGVIEWNNGRKERASGYELGMIEFGIGMERMDRAIKHWMIGANLGDEQSLTALKLGYPTGFVMKKDLAAALRAYQAAVDGMKSPDREVAAEIAKQENY